MQPRLAEGVRLAGVEMDAGAPLGEQIERRAKALEGRLITLRIPNSEWEIQGTFAQLGLRVDQGEVQRRLEMIGNRGGWLTRLEERRAARYGGFNIPLSVQLDVDELAGQLSELKEYSDAPGRAARFKVENGAIAGIIPDQPGVYLDVDESAALLRAAFFTGARELALSTREVPPEVNAELLSRVGYSRVMAEFTSRFARGGDADNRAVNIEIAASRIDGVVLAPSVMVSFNELVGARTLQNGFRPGWEIFRGEMVRGIGGGTCQVSSTLYAASVYAGLDAPERAPHSRPSGYMPLGLDAAVAWPSVDLKLTNPWHFPVVIRATVSGNELRMQILGEDKPADISWRTETLAVIPFKRKITESHWLAEGTVIKKQKGIRGYRLKRIRTLRLAQGGERVEESLDTYPATPEHFVVPRGSNFADLLPEPGEGAAQSAPGLAEGRGVVIASQERFEP